MMLLVSYPFLLWALSAYRKRDGGPMAASVVPAALTPLFVASTAGWLRMASLLQWLSLAGAGGRAVRAAEASNAFVMITFGGVITALIATACWVRDRVRSEGRRESGPAVSGGVRLEAFGLGVVLAGLLLSQFFVAERVVDAGGPPPISMGTALILAAAAGAGAVVSAGWLLLSRRVAALQIYSMRGVIAGGAAVGAMLLTYAGWRVAAGYLGIAAHG